MSDEKSNNCANVASNCNAAAVIATNNTNVNHLVNANRISTVTVVSSLANHAPTTTAALTSSPSGVGVGNSSNAVMILSSPATTVTTGRLKISSVKSTATVGGAANASCLDTPPGGGNGNTTSASAAVAAGRTNATMTRPTSLDIDELHSISSRLIRAGGLAPTPIATSTAQATHFNSDPRHFKSNSTAFPYTSDLQLLVQRQSGVGSSQKSMNSSSINSSSSAFPLDSSGTSAAAGFGGANNSGGNTSSLNTYLGNRTDVDSPLFSSMLASSVGASAGQPKMRKPIVGGTGTSGTSVNIGGLGTNSSLLYSTSTGSLLLPQFVSTTPTSLNQQQQSSQSTYGKKSAATGSQQQQQQQQSPQFQNIWPVGGSPGGGAGNNINSNNNNSSSSVSASLLASSMLLANSSPPQASLNTASQGGVSKGGKYDDYNLLNKSVASRLNGLGAGASAASSNAFLAAIRFPPGVGYESRSEYESLYKRYAELDSFHVEVVSKLSMAQAENIKHRQRYESIVSDYDVLLKEKASLKQQCTKVVQEWQLAEKKHLELQIEIEKMRQQRDEANLLAAQVMEDKKRILQEQQQMYEAKKMALNEYNLIMSERDLVHKEMDHLNEEVTHLRGRCDELQKKEVVQDEEIKRLRQEVASALLERDKAVAMCRDMRQESAGAATSAAVQRRLSQQSLQLSSCGIEAIFSSHSSSSHQSLQQSPPLVTQQRQQQQQPRPRVTSPTVTVVTPGSKNKMGSSTSSVVSGKFDGSGLLQPPDFENAETMRKQFERLQLDLQEAYMEIELLKGRRDWAFQERDTIVKERESIRTLCDNLRRERDRKVSDLAEALRESDEIKRQKNEANKELKKLKEKFHQQQLAAAKAAAAAAAAAAKQTGKTPEVVSSTTSSGSTTAACTSQDSAIDVDGANELNVIELNTSGAVLETLELSLDLNNNNKEDVDWLQHVLLKAQIACVAYVTKLEANSNLILGDRIISIDDLSVDSIVKSQIFEYLKAKRKVGENKDTIQLKIFRQLSNPSKAITALAVDSPDDTKEEADVIVTDKKNDEDQYKLCLQVSNAKVNVDEESESSDDDDDECGRRFDVEEDNDADEDEPADASYSAEEVDEPAEVKTLRELDNVLEKYQQKAEEESYYQDGGSSRLVNASKSSIDTHGEQYSLPSVDVPDCISLVSSSTGNASLTLSGSSVTRRSSRSKKNARQRATNENGCEEISRASKQNNQTQHRNKNKNHKAGGDTWPRYKPQQLLSRVLPSFYQHHGLELSQQYSRQHPVPAQVNNNNNNNFDQTKYLTTVNPRHYQRKLDKVEAAGKEVAVDKTSSSSSSSTTIDRNERLLPTSTIITTASNADNTVNNNNNNNNNQEVVLRAQRSPSYQQQKCRPYTIIDPTIAIQALQASQQSKLMTQMVSSQASNSPTFMLPPGISVDEDISTPTTPTTYKSTKSNSEIFNTEGGYSPRSRDISANANIPKDLQPYGKNQQAPLNYSPIYSTVTGFPIQPTTVVGVDDNEGVDYSVVSAQDTDIDMEKYYETYKTPRSSQRSSMASAVSSSPAANNNNNRSLATDNGNNNNNTNTNTNTNTTPMVHHRRQLTSEEMVKLIASVNNNSGTNTPNRSNMQSAASSNNTMLTKNGSPPSSGPPNNASVNVNTNSDYDIYSVKDLHKKIQQQQQQQQQQRRAKHQASASMEQQCTDNNFLNSSNLTANFGEYYLPSQQQQAAAAVNIPSRPIGLKYPYHYPAIAEGLGHYKPSRHSLNLSNVSFSMPASNIKTIINELPNLTATATTGKPTINEQLFAQPEGIYAVVNRHAKYGVPTRSLYGEVSNISTDQTINNNNNNQSSLSGDHTAITDKALRLSAYSSVRPTAGNGSNIAATSPYHLEQLQADFTLTDLANVEEKFLSNRSQRLRIPSNQSSTSSTVASSNMSMPTKGAKASALGLTLSDYLTSAQHVIVPPFDSHLPPPYSAAVGLSNTNYSNSGCSSLGLPNYASHISSTNAVCDRNSISLLPFSSGSNNSFSSMASSIVPLGLHHQTSPLGPSIEVKWLRSNLDGSPSNVEIKANEAKPNDYRQISIDRGRTSVSFGFRILSKSEAVFVEYVQEGTLAAQAGIKIGDQIISIFGIDFRGTEKASERATMVLSKCTTQLQMVLQLNKEKYLELIGSDSLDSLVGGGGGGGGGGANNSKYLPSVSLPSPSASCSPPNKTSHRDSATQAIEEYYNIVNGKQPSPPSNTTTSSSDTSHQRLSSIFLSNSDYPVAVSQPQESTKPKPMPAQPNPTFIQKAKIDTNVMSSSMESSTNPNITIEDTKTIIKPSEGTLRKIVLKKSSSSLGLSLIGGNAVGIFIHSFRDETLLASGLRVGDQIIEYNGYNLCQATAEEAAIELAKPAESIEIVVANDMTRFNKVKQANIGDSFYIRCAFDRPSIDGSLSFHKDDILYIDNTMHNGVPGLWRAWNVSPTGEKKRCGVIPSRYKAEEEMMMRRGIGGIIGNVNNSNNSIYSSIGGSLLATISSSGTADPALHIGSGTASLGSSTRRSFFRRRKTISGGTAAALLASGPLSSLAGGIAYLRSSSKDSATKEIACYSDLTSLTVAGSLVKSATDATDADAANEAPGASSGELGYTLPVIYVQVEKVNYTAPRPVIIVGPLKELFIEKLEQDFPHDFKRCMPELVLQPGVDDNLMDIAHFDDDFMREKQLVDYRRRGAYLEFTTIPSVCKIADNNMHALLDISLNSVARLHQCRIYPVVVFLKFKSIRHIKEFMSSNSFPNDKLKKAAKEMYEHSCRLESEYKDIISVTIASTNLTYTCTQVKASVELEQKKALWL